MVEDRRGGVRRVQVAFPLRRCESPELIARHRRRAQTGRQEPVIGHDPRWGFLMATSGDFTLAIDSFGRSGLQYAAVDAVSAVATE